MLHWDSSDFQDDPYPGREFVATLDCYPPETFTDRCDRLLHIMNAEGLHATCPGSSVFSSILVPTEEATRARVFLRTLKVDWITGWIADENQPQGFQFGCYNERANGE